MAGNFIVPYQWHDWIPASFKIAVKRLFYPASSAYQVIIHGGGRRADWALGMQPDRVIMRRLESHYPKVTLISILSRNELIIKQDELALEWPNWSRLQLQWYDHSICNPVDGRNQGLLQFKEFLSSVHKLWMQGDSDLFYCHCMAGRGRSFLCILAWLLYYGDQVDCELRDDSPNLAELAAFVAGFRPQVFGLQGLEGEQRGFAGLLSLDWLVNQPLSWWQQRDPVRLQVDLQCAGLALTATIDDTYRLASDLDTQQCRAVQMFSLAKCMNIGRDALEVLLWTPPWKVLDGLVLEWPISKLRTLRQQSWMQLPAVARANWQRWQYWCFTAN